MSPTDDIHIALDSIYVNEIEKSDTITHQILIAYYLTLKNLRDSPIHLPVERNISDETAEARFWLINSSDTLKLYLATQDSLVVPAKGQIYFGLTTNTIHLVDLFKKHGYSLHNHVNQQKLSETEFLKKIATKSYISFQWNRFIQNFSKLDTVKIIYRDPADNTIE